MICSVCRQDLPPAEPNRRVCRKCRNKQHADWARRNRDKVNAYARSWMKDRRWLDGIGDREDKGPDIGVHTEVRANTLHVYRGREKIA